MSGMWRMSKQQDPRIKELLDQAEELGIALPLPPSVIVAVEDAGAIVNLRTGSIEVNGVCVRYSPTDQALANAPVKGWDF